MRSVGQGEERENFVDLVVLKDTSNRKLYPWANLLRGKLRWLPLGHNNAPGGQSLQVRFQEPTVQ